MSEELEISKYQKKYLKQQEEFFNHYGSGAGRRDPFDNGGIRVELCEYGKNKWNSYWITFNCIGPNDNDIYAKTLWCKRKYFEDRTFLEGEQLHRDLEPFGDENYVRPRF